MPRTTNPLVVGRVIGDVLEPFTSSVSMRVVYDNNKEVINSIELKPSQIVNQPIVDVGGDDLRTLYTLVSSAVLKHRSHSSFWSFLKFYISLATFRVVELYRSMS